MNRLTTTLTLASLLSTSAALAQAPLPEGLRKADQATSGSTDVADEGFKQAEKVEEGKDTTEAKISAGALLSTGNARSAAATASGDFRLRRGTNQFTGAAAANYARAGAPGEGLETTVENYQGKLRYDRFLYQKLAVFLSTTARRDRFQGLDLRLNVDPGLSYYLIDEKKQLLWAEAGYDLQYDVRRNGDIDAARADGEILDKTETRHHARLFAGYENKLSESVSFTTGLEYLRSLTDNDNWRLNWDASLNSKIAGNFSTATSFMLKYDNNPLPDVEKVDTVTAISLVYSFY